MKKNSTPVKYLVFVNKISYVGTDVCKISSLQLIYYLLELPKIVDILTIINYEKIILFSEAPETFEKV
jgi:hypothetical protein